jgi:hypothetical protein
MTLRLVIPAVLALALLAPTATSGAAQQRTENPRSTLLRQAGLLKQAKWRAMYATFTPRFRRSCSYAKFVRQQRQTRQFLGPSFQLRGIQVRLETARRAIIAYRFVRDGRTLASVTFRHRDVYVLIGSRWFDELDRVSTCGS